MRVKNRVRSYPGQPTASRVPAQAEVVTQDSFANFAARIGLHAGNLNSKATTVADFITRQRLVLDYAYRSSWMVGMAIDAIAEDMTSKGVDLLGSITPEEMEDMEAAQLDWDVWGRLCEAISWSRLYGGAVAIPLIDGQDMSTPLNLDTIGRGQFKGLLVLDRWMVNPSYSELVTDFGLDLGQPMYYQVVADSPCLPSTRIHYSRVMRFTGIDLPYIQKQTENGWGESVIERIHDRLVAFDSTTLGAAQLVHKAHLRTVQIEGYREIVAMGGKAMEGLAKQMEMIRLFQTIEGLTVLDAKDKFETHQYSFSGLGDLMLQFGQQISGATQIPLVRLFGQSPSGLNSSGESDLRTYYDGIRRTQTRKLRRPIILILDLLHRSILGRPPAPDFAFDFRPLWQTSDNEKADIAGKVVNAVVTAYEANIISLPVAMKELRQTAHTTGLFSNISDADIEDAEAAPPPSELATRGEEPDARPGAEGGGEPSEESVGKKPDGQSQGGGQDA